MVSVACVVSPALTATRCESAFATERVRLKRVAIGRAPRSIDLGVGARFRTHLPNCRGSSHFGTAHSTREVDLFVEDPIDFELYERSQIVVLATTNALRVRRHALELRQPLVLH